MESELFLPHHIKIMKVALALAIIRQTPRGMSAREFTERLALQFGQLQTDWRERALQLEQELLRTRQELLSYQIPADNLSQSDQLRAHSQQSRGSQPLPLPSLPPALSQEPSDSEWQSSGYCSSLPGNSQGLGTPLEYRSDQCKDGTMEEAGNSTGYALPERIRAHVKFLSSVSSLMNAQHDLSAVTSSDLRAAVRDTILDATKGLAEALVCSHVTLPVSQASTEAAVRTILNAVQVPEMQPFQAELIEACVGVLSALIHRLVDHKGILKNNQQCLKSLVIALCSIPELFRHAIGTLTQHVVSFAELLVKATEDASCIDPDMVENTGAVLCTLEALLNKYDATTLSHKVCSKLTEELESSLLQLSSMFPLFTYSVWKITAYLSIPEAANHVL